LNRLAPGDHDNRYLAPAIKQILTADPRLPSHAGGTAGNAKLKRKFLGGFGAGAVAGFGPSWS
jgi:hypothetical protein